jgi:hypothetical protein
VLVSLSLTSMLVWRTRRGPAGVLMIWMRLRMRQMSGAVSRALWRMLLLLLKAEMMECATESE